MFPASRPNDKSRVSARCWLVDRRSGSILGTHRKARPERDLHRSAEGATRPETLRQTNGDA
jgi:hypothetical protein